MPRPKGSKLTEEHKRKIGEANKNPSEETRKKLSDASKGENNYNYGKTGEKHPNFGRHHTEEAKRKMTETHLGDKNCNWNPNLTDEDRQDQRKYTAYYEWRKSVYERDYFTCQKCFYKGKHINAHHIESYANNKYLRITVENGITFCVSCHKNFHRIYGLESTTEKVNEFLSENNK